MTQTKHLAPKGLWMNLVYRDWERVAERAECKEAFQWSIAGQVMDRIERFHQSEDKQAVY
jgi:hypothetical protein